MHLKKQIDEYEKIEHMLDVLYGNGMQAFSSGRLLDRGNWTQWSEADVVWKKAKFVSWFFQNLFAKRCAISASQLALFERVT